MRINSGVIANANKALIGGYKLSLYKTASSEVIYQTDSFNTMVSYLNSYTIADPLTLQFNTSDTFVLTGNLTMNWSNGSNLFKVKAATGVSPILDANNTYASVVTVSMSNFEWNGVNCYNADITNSSGCIMRVNSNTTNVTIKNMKFKRGYCAMRATGTLDGSGNVVTYIDGLTIKDCTIEDVINGSFRLGNGDAYGMAASTNFSLRTTGYYDLRNVYIENITLIDNFNKGVITGQATGFMGMLILKRILNLTVKNFFGNNTSESFLQIDACANVLVNKAVIDNFGCRGLSNQQGMNIDNTDGCTLINTFIKANADGVGKLCTNFSNVKNLWLFYNTFTYINSNDTPFYAEKISLVKLVGNIFKASGSSNPCEISFTTSNGYTPSIAQDVLAEDYNVFCSAGTYNTNLKYTNQGTVTIDVQVQINTTGSKISPATYRSTYSLGANSVFTTDTNVLFSTRTNPNATTSLVMYVTDGKQGRNLIPSVQQSVDIDAFGFLRTYPTDAGATDRDATVLA